ncbi:MAG: hypothetical protein P0S95_08125 [Rhabdochlamydiaceae bacterium]|nr:hypothetical protein [Candidatus Amphrikana amoebophyrae]
MSLLAIRETKSEPLTEIYCAPPIYQKMIMIIRAGMEPKRYYSLINRARVLGSTYDMRSPKAIVEALFSRQKADSITLGHPLIATEVSEKGAFDYLKNQQTIQDLNLTRCLASLDHDVKDFFNIKSSHHIVNLTISAEYVRRCLGSPVFTTALAKLKFIDLEGRKIIEIPHQLAQHLSQVTKVDLRGSRLFQLPDAMNKIEVVIGFKSQQTVLNPLHSKAKFQEVESLVYQPALSERNQELNINIEIDSNSDKESDSSGDSST